MRDISSRKIRIVIFLILIREAQVSEPIIPSSAGTVKDNTITPTSIQVRSLAEIILDPCTPQSIYFRDLRLWKTQEQA